MDSYSPICFRRDKAWMVQAIVLPVRKTGKGPEIFLEKPRERGGFPLI
jgi:hypothetical protein